MNTASTELPNALAATHRTLQRRARWRLALMLLQAAMTAAALWLIGGMLLDGGTGLLPRAWPGLLAALAGAAVLLRLLRSQRLRLQRLQRRALPVRAALLGLRDDAEQRRAQSRQLLGLAAVSVPLLWLSVVQLAASGAIDERHAGALGLFCLLPGIVIGIVHGTRLRRCRQASAEVSRLLAELDGK